LKKMIFITGGARSGKSRYAQLLALEQSPSPIYVATARIWDEEFRERIDRHRRDRDDRWTSLEEEKFLSRLPLQGRTAVIDCVTLWITNFFSDAGYDIDACFASWSKRPFLSSSAMRSGWACMPTQLPAENLPICKAG
jgi:adenosylcobinamide kinase/adenosylcobinamide-phosphate guanylyltransferase